MQANPAANNKLASWLTKPPAVLVVYISICAFVVYSCMYGFRKPYTVGTYGNISFMGISYKVCLVIAQVLGYMFSKFYGIRFISAMKPERRAFYILLFIGTAWASLLLFALIPPPYNIICMFVNGLPLGMVFGLVLGSLEGRRTSELMGAVLATSFIFASGLAKTIGKWLQLDYNVTDWWMPFAAGAVFVVPLLISVWLLSKAPPPSQEDKQHRTERKPMTALERKGFIRQFGTSLVAIVAAYVVFTIVRDFCEDFANELWTETGYRNNAGIFAKTSTIISVIALAVIGGFFLIKNNYRAFRISHFIIMAGVLLSAVATICFNLHLLSPFTWMVLAVTGMYLAYIPFNCMFFERMLAAYKINGNVGFVMYIADSFGYLGTVTVLLIKEFIPIQYSWVSFFSFLFYTAGILGFILVIVSLYTHSKLYKSLWKGKQPL
jgi:MFS family permease